MPQVILASALARWLTATPRTHAGERSISVIGSTVREALENLFVEFPHLRGYLFDEAGVLRHHVVAYVNGVAVNDKKTLADTLTETSEVYLFQALSGG